MICSLEGCDNSEECGAWDAEESKQDDVAMLRSSWEAERLRERSMIAFSFFLSFFFLVFFSSGKRRVGGRRAGVVVQGQFGCCQTDNAWRLRRPSLRQACRKGTNQLS